MRMPSSSRRLCANLAILLLIFAGIPTLFSQAAWGTWHTGSNTLAAAKKMARDSNRPLLVVAGAINCAYCETLEENVLHTAEMHNFAYNNKVVLFECRDLQKLSDRLHVNYGKACGMSKTYPYSFLFRVNPDADVTNVNWKSLDPSEVTLLAVASGPYAGSKSGFTYAAAKSINGIRIENEANWKASTYIEVLKSYFPNQQWATIVPPAGGDDPPPGGDDPPPGGDDPPPGGDDPPPGGDDPPIGPIDDSLWGGIWLQTNQLAQAKAYALANNRPLLVVAGAINCAHCDSLERMVLHTAEFRNYAKEKKIVLFECRDLQKLSDRLSVNYGKACGMSKTYPYSFLFTVNPGADLTTSDWKSLDPSEVTLLTIASGFYAGNKSGFNYAAVKSINGIKLEAEANWKAATYIAVLESFFPNQQWATINPPAAPPLSGYENAINLGRIPSLEYPPATASKWITYSVNQSLTTAVNERWYKFTGDLNKRYVFSAKDIINANPGVNITFTLYASTLVNGVSTPKTPALKTVTSLGFDALDRGIQVDMSTGTATNLTFLLRIKHDGSAPMNDMFYTLKVHEAQRAPAPGTVTNPHWAGAVPGQWTMDRTAAEAQSLIDGKPIIYLFSGLLWCPYCVGLDHNVLQTPAFAAATANAYLVALDNRDRYGNGPSLLRDNTTGGYLETNSIDENEAEAKLEDNIAVQNALALPTATAWGPGDAWKKIGYPTLVYCVPTAGGTRATFNGLATVGRISGDYEADSVIAKLNDLAIMAADGFVEDNTFASLSTQEIGTDSPVNSRIGGSLIAADWWQFTVSPDMAAAFTAQSDNPPAEAMITLTVYSEDGLTALKTLTAPANVAARLDFAPPMSTGGTFWLRVSATGANASFAYALTFAEASLNYKLAMATEEIYVSRRHEEATVTVRIIEQKANDQDIRFRYRVIAAPENALNEFYFTATDWSEVTIPHADKPAGEINLTAAYHIPAEVPLWTDSRDFIIEIDAVAGGNAQVDGTASRTIVKVMSTTVFAPRPTVTSFDLIKDVPVSGLVFPVCVGGTANNVLLPGADAALPAGLNVEWVDDPAQPRIVISGAPTELDAVGKTVRLGLFTDIDHVDNLDVHFTVSDMPPSGSITAFAGYLTSMLDDTAARAIRGDIKIDNDLNGPIGKITLRVATQDTAAPVEFESEKWTSYSPAAGNLVLDLVDNGTGAKLLLYVAPDGNICGTYTSPQAIPYSIHAAARSDIPEEYEGYYTVALRELNEDDTYNFHGWLQVDVNAAGVVTYQGEMIDGTAIGPQTTYITPSVNIDVAPDKKPYGDLIFFQPLYWSEELGKFSGRLAGRLVIFPKTDREGEGINDAWISACYGNEVDNPIWEKSAHDYVCLDPCGTVFDSTRSVAAQVDPDSESPYFYFNVQTPAAPGIVIPDHILLEEIPATPAMTIAAEGILAAELSDLAYNKDTGVLTGTINVLNAANGSALNRTECAIRGILTPITSDCCRETADLAVGYGYFNHQNATYIITLNATAVLAAEAPTLVDLEGQAGPDFNVVFQKAAVSLTIDAPTQKVLRRETDLDGNTSLFLYDWTDEYETNKEFTLPTLRQEFVGLEDGKAESDILAIPLTPAEAVATFAVPDADGNVPDGAIAVQPGWNLLGVPWDIKLAADYVPGPGWKACDPIQNAFVPASALETGAAYWIFIKDNTLPFDIPGLLLMQPTPMPPDAPAEWRCIADPGQGTRWFWVDGQFTTDPPEQPKWQGVWHYPDH